MAFRRLNADAAFWRPSNQMGVMNSDLAKQLEARSLGARLWRLEPGQASTKHRHAGQEEVYIVLEGVGRIRIDDEPMTLERLDAVLVEADSVRQVQRRHSDAALAGDRGAARAGEHARDDGGAAQLPLPGRSEGASARARRH
jgi:quercetin dioxygenase-like cupin family protein